MDATTIAISIVQAIFQFFNALPVMQDQYYFMLRWLRSSMNRLCFLLQPFIYVFYYASLPVLQNCCLKLLMNLQNKNRYRPAG
jgi:Zn-dependent protease